MTDTEINHPVYRDAAGFAAPFAMELAAAGRPITDPDTAREAISFLFHLEMIDITVEPGVTPGEWLGTVDEATGWTVLVCGDVEATDEFSGYSARIPSNA